MLRIVNDAAHGAENRGKRAGTQEENDGSPVENLSHKKVSVERFPTQPPGKAVPQARGYFRLCDARRDVPAKNVRMRCAKGLSEAGDSFQQAGGARVDWNSTEAAVGECGRDAARRTLLACRKKAVSFGWGWAHCAVVTARAQSPWQQLASWITGCPDSEATESWQW